MLLNDIGKPTDSTFKRINQHLESNYGFKISEDICDKDLVAIMEKIQDEIVDLKIKGEDSKSSPEISKRLIVLEGIRSLREFALDQYQSPKLDFVIKNMIDFVVDTFEISAMGQADFDRAVERAMDEYRSSRYRFPDEIIENRVRTGAATKIDRLIKDSYDPEMGTPSVSESPYGTEGKRSSALGGSAGEVPDTDAGRFAAQALNNPGLSLVGNDSDEEQTPMIRNPNTGKIQADPFAAQRAERRKGILMKEKEQIDELTKLANFDPQAKPGEQVSRPTDRAGRDDLAQRATLSKERKKAALPQGNANRRGASSGISNYGVDSKFSGHDPMAKGIAQMKENTNLVKNLRMLLETEVSQAEVMMAAKDFSKELQEMVEKIGRLQNEDLPPVTDQMRETYGMESASAFQTQIYGALQSVMDSLYTAKGQVDDAVTNMATTGIFTATTDMDKDIGMDDGMGDLDAEMGDELDLDNLDDEGEEDEFGGAEQEEPLGRAMKESALQRKVMEMQRLVEKARKLKEASR